MEKLIEKHAKVYTEESRFDTAKSSALITQDECIKYLDWGFKRAGLNQGELTPEAYEIAKKLFQVFLNESK
jgi:hypothetical protein